DAPREELAPHPRHWRLAERFHSGCVPKKLFTSQRPEISEPLAAVQGDAMPTYQNVVPPISLSSGDIGFSFNNEAFPAANTAGSQFALPSYTGLPDGGTSVRWQTIFGTNPTAVNTVLQAAMNDVDSEYQTIKTTTAPAGEAPTGATVQARFLRIKFVSPTGGSGLTAKILVKTS